MPRAFSLELIFFVSGIGEKSWHEDRKMELKEEFVFTCKNCCFTCEFTYQLFFSQPLVQLRSTYFAWNPSWLRVCTYVFLFNTRISIQSTETERNQLLDRRKWDGKHYARKATHLNTRVTHEKANKRAATQRTIAVGVFPFTGAYCILLPTSTAILTRGVAKAAARWRHHPLIANSD